MFNLLINIFCVMTLGEQISYSEKAQTTLDAIYDNYSNPGTELLREYHPYNTEYEVSYLGEKKVKSKNKYSYLWPYSGTFSATNAIYEATKDNKYRDIIDEKVLPGLEEYFDEKRKPVAYSSYINDAPVSDRFYDDNVWIAIDFVDTYNMTSDKRYLDKAELLWNFLMSGNDEKLGGGIYWCEQKKESKNTCSNAPVAVLGAKLYLATKDDAYLKKSKELYHWTKSNLEDKKDHLYFDKIFFDRKIDKAKFAYNSGQMMQAASLLYKITKEKKYLSEAQTLAKACHKHFFINFTDESGNKFMLLKKGNIWFSSIMLRGFIELYSIDKHKEYLNDFKKSLDYAWNNAIDEKGLFHKDLI